MNAVWLLLLAATTGEEPTTFFDDPRLLEVWDRDASSPLSLAGALGRLAARKLEPGVGSSGALLATFTPTWGVITKTLGDDLAQIVRELGVDWEKDITKTYDVTAAKTEVGKDKWHRGNGNVVRIFEEKWLSSADGQFLLSGVVFRPDRRDFDPGSCGELRLLYRLAYEVEMNGKVYASRMPFVVNVVYRVPTDPDRSCKAVASSWKSAALTDANAAEVAATLLRGPLDLSRVQFQQIELNAQIARFPSDLENVDKRKFAGQAIYWMRIFALAGDRLAPRKLENTPDVDAIRRDPAKKQALLAAIERNLEGIDLGVFVLPEPLLAELALSYSTLGSVRLANRPFELLLTRAEADALAAKISGPRFVGSGAALLDRLNGATCMGCHQSSSTAGFHFLGVDRPFGRDPKAVWHATDGNRLELPFSPHFYAETSRRRHYASRLARGLEPERLRPHPSAPIAEWTDDAVRFGAAGNDAPCFVSGLVPASSWRCEAGLECRTIAVNPALSLPVGQCLPSKEAVVAGLACRLDVLQDSLSKAKNDPGIAFNVRAFEDRVVKEEALYPIAEDKLTADAYNCRPSKIGVPLGRVTRQCRSEERGLEGLDASSREACAVVGGKGFEEMARGYFDADRFAAGVGRGLLDVCSPADFCREDYICQQLPDFLATKKHGVKRPTLDHLRSAGLGFCTPTYFVYQLRLDGHPNPR